MSHIQSNESQPELVLPCLHLPMLLKTSLQNYFFSFYPPSRSQHDATAADSNTLPNQAVQCESLNTLQRQTHLLTSPIDSFSISPSSHLASSSKTSSAFVLFNISFQLKPGWIFCCVVTQSRLIHLLHSHFRGSVTCLVKKVHVSLCIYLDFVKL